MQNGWAIKHDGQLLAAQLRVSHSDPSLGFVPHLLWPSQMMDRVEIRSAEVSLR